MKCYSIIFWIFPIKSQKLNFCKILWFTWNHIFNGELVFICYYQQLQAIPQYIYLAYQNALGHWGFLYHSVPLLALTDWPYIPEQKRPLTLWIWSFSLFHVILRLDLAGFWLCWMSCLLPKHCKAEAQMCPSQWAGRDRPAPGTLDWNRGSQERVQRGGYPQQPPLCKDLLVLKVLLVFCGPMQCPLVPSMCQKLMV